MELGVEVYALISGLGRLKQKGQFEASLGSLGRLLGWGMILVKHSFEIYVSLVKSSHPLTLEWQADQK